MHPLPLQSDHSGCFLLRPCPMPAFLLLTVITPGPCLQPRYLLVYQTCHLTPTVGQPIALQLFSYSNQSHHLPVPNMVILLGPITKAHSYPPKISQAPYICLSYAHSLSSDPIYFEHFPLLPRIPLLDNPKELSPFLLGTNLY